MNPNPVVVVKTSLRSNSNSDLLADRVVDGLRAAGQAVEVIAAGALDIRPCKGCDACQQTQADDCTLDDDLQNVLPLLRRASGLVIAAPIYYMMVSAQAKLFIDRAFYPLNGPEGSQWAGKPLGVLLVFGDSDAVGAGALNALGMFKDIAHHCRMRWGGMLCASANAPAEAAQSPELLQAAFELGQKMAAAVA